MDFAKTIVCVLKITKKKVKRDPPLQSWILNRIEPWRVIQEATCTTVSTKQ